MTNKKIRIVALYSRPPLEVLEASLYIGLHRKQLPAGSLEQGPAMTRHRRSVQYSVLCILQCIFNSIFSNVLNVLFFAH